MNLPNLKTQVKSRYRHLAITSLLVSAIIVALDLLLVAITLGFFLQVPHNLVLGALILVQLGILAWQGILISRAHKLYKAHL
jgi:hypothetical protein